MYDYLILGFILVALLYIIRYLPFIIKYLNSKYKQESGIGLLKFLFDSGYFGEGLTFFELEKLKVYSKVMTNLYIPTEDGTTEIDLLFICPSGIYVIESKNYSGWIYGSENSRNWTSVLNRNTKNKFLNPIWQNKKHIKHLSKIIEDTELKSLVIFSERCTLKKIDSNIVIKRNELNNYLTKEFIDIILSNEQINKYYEILKQYSNVSDEVKEQHIDNIKKDDSIASS